MMRETNPPRTATEARRHRPSTKTASTAKKNSRTAKAARPARKVAPKQVVLAEDKRESTDEVVTDARPKNLTKGGAGRKAKGRAVHALEARSPEKRPSRKSTRRGANGAKPDVGKRREALRRVRSPKARHAMAQ
jgi:hypothetical protein